MFQFKSKQAFMMEERKKNEWLQAQAIKQRADIDYLAMMSDVELEEGDVAEVLEHEEV